MREIRQTIFQSSDGDIDGTCYSFRAKALIVFNFLSDIEVLTTNPGEYGLFSKICSMLFINYSIGSYAGAGHLLSSINTTGSITNYTRWLDIDQGLARTSWTQNGDNILR